MLKFILPFFFLPFSLFSISQSNVTHREICVKGFSGTTAPRIFKFDTNIGYYYVLCKRESILMLTFHVLVHFSFSPVTLFFVKDFSGTTAIRILKFGTNIGYD